MTESNLDEGDIGGSEKLERKKEKTHFRQFYGIVMKESNFKFWQKVSKNWKIKKFCEKRRNHKEYIYEDTIIKCWLSLIKNFI